jgi:diadenosine tetraphosphatase ApaH/serine/threonine PP2A family protein phosphatase
VLVALFSDLHANREAVSACLAHARAHGAKRSIFLGDYVGYGADPEWVLDTVMAEVERGAVALLGNHDAAVNEFGESMLGTGQSSIEWTRVQLGARHRAFLSRLPLTHEKDGRLFVHASAAAPGKWQYVHEEHSALRCLRATAARAVFCGHVHEPALYHLSEGGKLGTFAPVPAAAVPLSPLRRWLAIVGSAGQPRDGNPEAAYALLDTARNEITWHRVPYDVETAMAKVRAAGLPASLAERLRTGL